MEGPYNRAIAAYHKKLWKYKIQEQECKEQNKTPKQANDLLNKLWRDVCKSEKILNRIAEYHNRPRMQWVYVGPGANLNEFDFFLEPPETVVYRPWGPSVGGGGEISNCFHLFVLKQL